MVFILSALWWIRIRGLWKLPDGRDWLGGKLGLVLMGGVMLSKSLIHFSIDGRGCVPSLLFGLKPDCWPTRDSWTLTGKSSSVSCGDTAPHLVMYARESWTIKKAVAFELWCWRRFLRVPWTAERSNQSILKKISPKYSLEGLMLKLKLQYFGHLMWRVDSSEKTLMLGKIEGRRRGDDRGWDG